MKTRKHKNKKTRKKENKNCFYAFMLSCFNDESGQSLMEIMIALAVGAILIGGASIAVVVVLQSGSTNQIQQSATVLAQEIVEKGRIYGMADWSNLYDLEKSSSTKYFLNTSSTELFHIEGVEGIVDGDIREGLVGHWKLDEATSTTAYDFSGNGNNGSTSSAVATSTGNCLIGQCYSFDGGDDYIQVSDNLSLSMTNSLTLSVWIKTAVNSAGDGGSQGIIDTQESGDRGYRMTVENGVIEFGIYAADLGASYTELNGSTLISDNLWHHLVGTWDGFNMLVYVDGGEDGSAIQSDLADSPQDLMIGVRDKTAGFFDGLIDDVRIYNRVLSADEVEHLYNSTFFDRYFYVDNACRTNDADYSLAGGAPCDAGEVEDPSTQLFTGVVEWAGKEGESSFSLSEYMTRWRNDIFHQTDWSGGSGDDGPVSNSSDAYSSSTSVDSSNLGEIRIEGL